MKMNKTPLKVDDGALYDAFKSVMDFVPGQTDEERDAEAAKIKGRKYFRGSELGRCARSIGYNLLGYKGESISQESRQRFSDGHLHHNDIKHRLRLRFGKDFHSEEAEFKKTVRYGNLPPFTIVGHVDGLYRKNAVVEIKSMSHFSFKKASREQDMESRSYHYQAQIYMFATKRKRCIWVLKNKNTGELDFIILKRDKKLIRKILKRLGEMQLSLNRKKLPKREYMEGSVECNRCEFNMICRPVKRLAKLSGEKTHRIIEFDNDDKLGRRLTIHAREYDEAKGIKEAAEERMDEAKKKLAPIFEKYKAKKAVSKDYSIIKVVGSRNNPDREVIQRLIRLGKIPMKMNSYEYIMVKSNKGEPDDE